MLLDHEEDSQSPEEDFGLKVDRTEWHKLLRRYSATEY
jgi:hypothetical protein